MTTIPFADLLKGVCSSIEVSASMDERFVMQAECDHQKFIFAGYIDSRTGLDFIRRIQNFHDLAKEQNLIAS